MNIPHIHLRAYHTGMFYAWQKYFEHIDNVTISQGDILRETADAIVSPANSFGYMDGGIDLVYSMHFGWDMEKRLRALLAEKYDGELPIGNAVVVETGRTDIRYLISAPTMRVPSNIENTANVYLAFRAVLRAVREFNTQRPGSISHILCPALGTGEGRMPWERAARQMYEAWRSATAGGSGAYGGLARAVEHHIELLR